MRVRSYSHEGRCCNLAQTKKWSPDKVSAEVPRPGAGGVEVPRPRGVGCEVPWPGAGGVKVARPRTVGRKVPWLDEIGRKVS